MEIDWNIIAGEAVTALLKVFVPVFVALILKWGTELWLKIKEQNPNIEWIVATAAEIGYNAAEEFFRGKTGVSEQKLEYALQVAENYLQDISGIKVDLISVKNAIISYGVSNNLFSWQEGDTDAGDKR